VITWFQASALKRNLYRRYNEVTFTASDDAISAAVGLYTLKSLYPQLESHPVSTLEPEM
jgi:hypothetical protein